MLYVGAILRIKNEKGDAIEEFEGVEYVCAKDGDQARLMVWDKFKEEHSEAQVSDRLVIVHQF